MTENMRKFLEKVSVDPDLAGRIGNMSKDEIMCTAQDLGCALTDADFKKQQSADFTDDELANVSGGAERNCLVSGVLGGTSHCLCIIAGGGKTDESGEQWWHG